jgi:hypothetical protein
METMATSKKYFLSIPELLVGKLISSSQMPFSKNGQSFLLFFRRKMRALQEKIQQL